MRRRALWLFALCALLAGCARGPGAISPAARQELETAFVLGRAILQRDVVSARATDLATPKALQAAGIRGWVTTRTPDGWRVDFYAPAGDHYVTKVRVTYPPVPDRGTGTLGVVDPPEPLDATRAAMARALALARTTRFPHCNRPYNHVVLPGQLAGEQGWIVYMLAAQLRHGEVVLGGHARIHVSADGRTLLKTTPLSRGCLIVPPRDPSLPKRVAITVTTPIDDVPFDTYFYVSMLNHVPILIARAGYLYQIDPLGLLRDENGRSP